MVTVKEAVASAIQAAKDFYSDTEIEGVQLEEVSLSGDEKIWYITLSFYVPDVAPTRSLLEMLATRAETAKLKPFVKKLKLFEIDSDNGKVRSMKIRD